MTTTSASGRLVRAGIVGVLAATALAGCAGDAELPPGEKEAINTGRNAAIGVVSAYNLLIIASAEQEPGRLLGVLSTSSDEAVEVTFADPDEEITVTVQPADGDEADGYSFEEHEHLFRTTESRPGGLAGVTVSVGRQSEKVRIPVLDGSLERYRPFLPED